MTVLPENAKSYSALLLVIHKKDADFGYEPY